MATASNAFQEIAPTSASASTSKAVYDVFINHRGPNTKHTLAYSIYTTLHRMGLNVFLDVEALQLGDVIPSDIEEAMSTSFLHIAILSPNYAQSPWCLAELAFMLKTGSPVIPVFYNVDPSDARFLKRSFADAFAEYEKKKRYSPEKLQDWKEALRNVSVRSGHILKDDDDVQRLCTKIAKAVENVVENTICLEVAKHPVGLNQLVEDFERQIGYQGNIVGVFAMGGSGKTTLVKEFFNRKRSNYGGRSSFVFDVREASAKDELPCLQSQLLKDLFNEDKKIRNVAEGTPILRDRMGRARNSFLIVLDDVDDQKQLDALFFKEYAKDKSLIIVTTRDERVLITAGITNRHRVKEMDRVHGIQLFCWNAFGVPKAPQGYETLVDSFVDQCRGLPLSIQVSAGNLYGTDDVAVWESELDKFRSTLYLDIKERLKLSIDRLDRDQTQIFMDIACFFNGRLKNIGVRIWKASGWKADNAVRILKDKCLIETEWSPSERLWDDDLLVFKMHDHLRDLGREMADQYTPPIRLWRPRDLNSLQTGTLKDILTKTQNQKIRCFGSIFDSSLGCYTKYFIGNSDDRTQALSDLLWIQPQLYRENSKLFYSFLQYSRIICGCFRRLSHEDIQNPSVLLKDLQLDETPFFEFPNQLGMLNELGMLHNLEDLLIEGNLWIEKGFNAKILSESLQKLTNLTRLVLRDCKLKGKLTLSSCGYLNKLRSVEIRNVRVLSKVIISGEYCSGLEKLVLDNVSFLNEVHLLRVKSMKSLTLSGCRDMKSVSGNFDQGKLEEVIIHECPHLEEFPELTRLSRLVSIQVKNSFNLPVNRNEDLEELEYLHLSNGRYTAIQYESNGELKSKTLYRTVSNGGIWTRIQRLKSLPSKAITLIGRAADGAESILNRHLFSGILGSADAVAELPRERNDNSNLSVIIVSLLVQTTSIQDVTVRLGPQHISSRLEPGKWIVTIVLTGQENLKYGQEYIAYHCMFVIGCRKQQVCTVKLNTGEEGSALPIVQKTVDELYGELYRKGKESGI